MDKNKKRLPEEAPPMDKIENDCRKSLCRRTNIRNVWRRIVRRWTKSKKVAGEVLADGLNQEKVAGEVLADGLNREKVAGEVLAADYPCGLSQERGSSDEMTARYGGRQAFAGEMMVLQNDIRLPVSRPLRKK